jgi:hypothetical protein
VLQAPAHHVAAAAQQAHLAAAHAVTAAHKSGNVGFVYVPPQVPLCPMHHPSHITAVALRRTPPCQ